MKTFTSCCVGVSTCLGDKHVIAALMEFTYECKEDIFIRIIDLGRFESFNKFKRPPLPDYIFKSDTVKVLDSYGIKQGSPHHTLYHAQDEWYTIQPSSQDLSCMLKAAIEDYCNKNSLTIEDVVS